jgi:hypothetical protein
MQLRERLGLDPKSEAELARGQAEAARSVVDLDALRERGRAALKARRDVGVLARAAGSETREGGDDVEGR